MIEKTILDYMTNKLSCPVVMERDGQTAPFVLIEKTGGGREDRINLASMAFQSYGASLYEAAELNEQVKTIMDDIELDTVSASLNSDYNFTDTSTKEYRYQALFDIRYIEGE